MNRKTLSIGTAVGGFAIFLVFLLVLSSRSGENEGFSGLWSRVFASPRAATVDEQREFIRLSLGYVLEQAASGTHAAKPPSMALQILPHRLCEPIPQMRGCEPTASGKRLLSDKAAPEDRLLQHLPMDLRRALVQVHPADRRLPNPELPGVIVHDESRNMTPEEQRKVLGLFRGEEPGGAGYAAVSWAVVSADGKTAAMDLVLVSPGNKSASGVEVFRRDAGGWRRRERLRY